MGNLWIPLPSGAGLGTHLHGLWASSALGVHPNDKSWDPGGQLGAALGAEEVSLGAPRFWVCGPSVRETTERLPATLCVAQARLGARLGEPGVPGDGRMA